MSHPKPCSSVAAAPCPEGLKTCPITFYLCIGCNCLIHLRLSTCFAWMTPTVYNGLHVEGNALQQFVFMLNLQPVDPPLAESHCQAFRHGVVFQGKVSNSGALMCSWRKTTVIG